MSANLLSLSFERQVPLLVPSLESIQTAAINNENSVDIIKDKDNSRSQSFTPWTRTRTTHLKPGKESRFHPFQIAGLSMGISLGHSLGSESLISSIFLTAACSSANSLSNLSTCVSMILFFFTRLSILFAMSESVRSCSICKLEGEKR